jgi:hypothetical protein
VIVGVAGPTKLNNLAKMASSLGIGASTSLLYSQPGRDRGFGLVVGGWWLVVGGWGLGFQFFWCIFIRGRVMALGYSRVHSLHPGIDEHVLNPIP